MSMMGKQTKEVKVQYDQQVYHFHIRTDMLNPGDELLIEQDKFTFLYSLGMQPPYEKETLLKARQLAKFNQVVAAGIDTTSTNGNRYLALLYGVVPTKVLNLVMEEYRKQFVELEDPKVC